MGRKMGFFDDVCAVVKVVQGYAVSKICVVLYLGDL